MDCTAQVASFAESVQNRLRRQSEIYIDGVLERAFAGSAHSDGSGLHSKTDEPRTYLSPTLMIIVVSAFCAHTSAIFRFYTGVHRFILLLFVCLFV
eukprot:COSAG05_NODE_317_length_11545_cov_73.981391_16_plen_96_part_00